MNRWLRDLLIVVAITIIAFVVASKVDLFEKSYSWTRSVEHCELDELMFTAMAFCVGMIWFVQQRRYVSHIQDTHCNAVEESLKKANEQLEVRVQKRTAELTASNQRLTDEMAQRKQAQEMLHRLAKSTSAVVGTDFFCNLVENIAGALGVRCVLIAQCVDNSPTRARSLALWIDGQLADNVEYDLSNTPCARVALGETIYYAQGVQQQFPQDKDLVGLHAQSYCGIPLFDVSDKVIGHLAILHDQPMDQNPSELPALQLFAARAAIELQRQRTEQALRNSERRYRRFYDETPSMYFTLDPQGMVVSVNPFGAQQLGYTPKELVGKSVLGVIYDEDKPSVNKHLATCLEANGQVCQWKFRKVCKDGRVIWVKETARAVPDNQGQMVVLIVCEDITEQEQAQKFLSLKRKVLEKIAVGANLQDVLNTLCGLIEEMTPGSVSTIMLLDEKTNRLRIGGKGPHASKECSQLLGGLVPGEQAGSCGTAAYLGKQVIVVDTLTDPRWAKFQSAVKRLNLRACWSIPIFSAGKKILGTFAISHSHPASPTDYQYQLLESAASLASIAIERQYAEQALRDSESHLRAIIETAPAAITVTDERGVIKSLNPAAEKVFGYTQDEVVGQSVNILMPTSYREEHDEHIDKYLKTGEPQIEVLREVAGLRKDGTEILLEGAVGESVSGTQRTFTAMMRDITDRKRSQEALRLTQYCVDHAAEAIFWSKPDGRLFYVNDVACQRLGYTREQLLNLSVSDFDTCCPDEMWPKQWQLCKQQGSYTTESTHQTISGRQIPVEITVNHLEFDDQEYFCCFARDITERHQAEREKGTLEAQLRQAHKLEAIGTLASGVAHDFNNLLMVISSHTEATRAKLGMEHPALQSIQIIEKACAQATGVTRSLLTFARKASHEKTPLDLVGLVKESIHLARRLLPASIELHQDLPQDQPIWIMGNQARLQQVILNLAINARDAMPDGGQLHLSLRLQHRRHKTPVTHHHSSNQDEAVMVFRDTGSGMSPSTLSRVFEPFYTTKQRGKGTGLGLSVVHGIIADLGGYIDVKSELSQGTRFTIRLLTCEPPSSITKNQKQSNGQNGHGQLIVLAEDNEYIRTIMMTSLEAAGYDVKVAPDGERAMRLFHSNQEKIRLMILDMDLPKKSGNACLDELKQGRPDLPVIIITGNLDRSLTEPFQHASSEQRILAKPFQMSKLIHEVGQVLTAAAAAAATS